MKKISLSIGVAFCAIFIMSTSVSHAMQSTTLSTTQASCIAGFIQTSTGCVPSSPAQTLNVVAPNGGESLVSGQTYRIKWTGGTKSVDVWLLDNPTRLGNKIFTGIANNGYVDWTVSALSSLQDNRSGQTLKPSGQYVIYVDCSAGDCIVANSNAPFTIINSVSTIPPTPNPAPIDPISVICPVGYTCTPTVANNTTPTVSSISPTSGTPGSYITLYGTGFQSGSSALLFNGPTKETVSPNRISGNGTRMLLSVPSDLVAGSYTISAQNIGNGSTNTSANSVAFTVTSTGAPTFVCPVGYTCVPTTTTNSSAPTISSVWPTSGTPGTIVTINGSGFTSNDTIEFDQNGRAMGGLNGPNVKVVSPNQIMVNLDPLFMANTAAGTYQLLVTPNYSVSGAGSNSVNFTLISSNTVTTPITVTPIVSTPVTSTGYQTSSGINPAYDIDVSTLAGLSKSDAITAMYQGLQHRAPDAQGLQYWTSYNADLGTIKSLMVGGIEYQSKMKIVNLYQSNLNRLPTDAELSKWYTVMNDNGFNIDAVKQGLGIGSYDIDVSTLSGLSKSDAITAMYQGLQHRAPDAQGLQYWTNYNADYSTIKSLMKSGIEYQSKMKIVSLFQSTYNRLPTDAELSKWYTVMNDNGFNIDVVRQGLGIGNTTYQQTCDSSSIWNGTSCVSQTTTQSICPTGYSWSGSTCTNSSLISSITVTYPQQGSVLSAGAKDSGLISFIKWTSTGSSNDTVSIALLSNNTVLKYIASGVPNTGSYAWQYDPSIQNGTYQIEVYDSQVKGGGANGMSGTFQIINSPAGSTYTTYPTPTPTTQSRSDAITQLYVTLDHRQPDAQGLSYYLNSNMTLDQIKQNMMSSREYQAVQTVTNLYQTLENRAPDDQGLRYYVGLIITNGWTVNQITTNMMNSAEYRSKHSVQTTTTPIQAQTASTTLR